MIDKIRQANLAQPTPEPNATSSSASVVSAYSVATTTSYPKKSFNCLLKDSRTSVSSSGIGVESALEKYLSQPCLKQEEDPLDFWKSHCQEADEFACITKLVPKYLCIPASSALIERIFTVAGKIFHSKQCHLTDKTSETLMFIKCNQDV